MMDNVPHDWLFKHVACVVHHGGAGTTAAGITAGRPTVIIPFFGDQPFWGAMVARAGAGPTPIPVRSLTADKLIDAVNFCLTPESQGRAKELASMIAAEQGSDVGAQSFHHYLEVDRLRCTLAPSRTATWRVKRTKVRLSAFAACTLANANLLDFHDLKLFRLQEYCTDEGPWDPISGGFTAALRAVGGMAMGIADVPTETWKAMQMPFGGSRQQNLTTMPTSTANGGSSRTAVNSVFPALPEQSQTSLISLPDPSALCVSTASGSQSDMLQGQWNSKVDDSTPKRVRSRVEPGSGRSQDMLRRTGAHTSKGLGRFAKALVLSPMELSVSFTKGFHNVPKLWGDDTVRPQEQVTDLKSGLKAVGREFGFGWYDGVTGMVTQPWQGARKEGASGFLKGVGKGIGGFVKKPGAALCGVLGHTMKGVHKEVQKMFGSNVQNYIVASRAAQGYEEWLQSSDAERQDVVDRWKRIQKYLKKKYNADEMMQDVLGAP
nr:isoform 2 of sterol 3-beta-glucosyltransferase ugt80a2 [Quercus suber]